jgi:hypothetical protein
LAYDQERCKRAAEVHAIEFMAIRECRYISLLESDLAYKTLDSYPQMALTFPRATREAPEGKTFRALYYSGTGGSWADRFR